MNKTKVLIAITSLGLVGTGLVNAQDLQTQNQNKGFGQKIMQNLTDAQKAILEQAKKLFESGQKDQAKQLLDQNGIKPFDGKMMRKGKNMMQDRKQIEDAIIAGDFVKFQQVASSSPLAKLDQTNFNLLVPQFQAKKNAEEQIKNILKNAGIETPQRKMSPGHGPGEDK